MTSPTFLSTSLSISSLCSVFEYKELESLMSFSQYNQAIGSLTLKTVIRHQLPPEDKIEFGMVISRIVI